MTDRKHVIAEAHGVKIWSDGVVDEGNGRIEPTKWSEMTVIAALLADAVRRLTEHIEAPTREEAPDA